jgi:hypothetical protein
MKGILVEGLQNGKRKFQNSFFHSNGINWCFSSNAFIPLKKTPIGSS